MKVFAILVAAAFLTVANSLQAISNPRFSAPAADEGQLDRQPHSYREIHTEALSKLVRSSNPSIKIVDARSIKTDDGKRIPGAKAIPFDATIENITDNLLDKEAMIIVYCSNAQCPASSLLVDRLVRMGYKNVWRYPEGIEEWEAGGQKIEQGKPAAEAAAETGPKSA